MGKIKYYDLKKIKDLGCEYSLIIGERSNGKTYAVNTNNLKDYCEKKIQFAYIRRWDEDIKQSKGSELFSSIVINGLVTEYTKGKYNSIVYRSRKWYLVNVNEDGELEDIDETPCGYSFALSLEEHYKSTDYPNVRNIFFDEFMTRNAYLPDEFVKFQNLLSTIIRLKDDVRIYMCANTVSKYGCPYITEMGLKSVSQMKKGTIDVYSYGKSTLRVAVEYSDFDSKKKKSNKYFAFDNPKLEMIKNGGWEIAIYPHLPYKYIPKQILYTFFIIYSEVTLQCEIINNDNDTFIYVHRKTTPIKDYDDELVYCDKYDPRPNYRRRINYSFTPLENKIVDLFRKEKIFYQDNEIGEVMRNYLLWCKQSHIQS